MTLNQIRYFYAAATLGNIGQAARQEMISQPSLSSAIHALEEELGVPLFDHSGRGVVLNQEGKEFLGYARSIMEQCDSALSHMKERSDALNKQVRIGYTASVSNAYIPELIERFTRHYHGKLQLYADQMSSKEAAAALRQGLLDIGICSDIDDGTELYQTPLRFDPLMLIVSKDHPLAKLDPEELPESPEALCHEPFISYMTRFPMYRLVSMIFESRKCQPDISVFAYSEDAIARLVEKGVGISIVAKTESLDKYDIAMLSPEWLKAGRFIYLTYAPHRYRGKAAEAMLNYILDHIRFEQS